MTHRNIDLNRFSLVCLLAFTLCLASCVDESPLSDTEVVTGLDIVNKKSLTTSRGNCSRRGLELIRLSGKVRNFGFDILQNPPAPKPLVGIPDVHVWLADYPFSKWFNVRTNEEGLWEMYIIKRRGRELDLSIMYEKDHYPQEVEAMVFPNGLPAGWSTSLIKSNIHTVGSDDITDFAMQMPDELFLYYAKSSLEGSISQLIGAPYAINNLAVATVGKSWASIYDPTLPHGDADADVVITPGAPTPLSGPIYFDETVTPNPTITSTSVDGGVLFNNLLPGVQNITAVKAPFEYDVVQFAVDTAVNLYIASPPHSIQGTNPSGPGEL